jgi:hypothetical protein
MKSLVDEWFNLTSPNSTAPAEPTQDEDEDE